MAAQYSRGFSPGTARSASRLGERGCWEPLKKEAVAREERKRGRRVVVRSMVVVRRVCLYVVCEGARWCFVGGWLKESGGRVE